MPSKPKILILTAAFGEGHNSAARNLALALQQHGAEAIIADPCLLSAPQATAILQWGYRQVTTHFPKIWEKIYQGTDNCDFSRPDLPLMAQPEAHLRLLLEKHTPHAVISTYPIYPYFLQRYFQEKGKKLPVFTVVTDSIEINASWLRAPTDYFLVTDQLTRDAMHHTDIPREKIINTGFAVNPTFSQLTPIPANDPANPFRILYFATAKKPYIRRHGRALLDASPDIHLTIVMGRNTRALYSRAKELRAAYPGRVRLLGWTRKVPQLFNKHHLVVGKAGGATVHEAIAAHCPMLIHHLVPGQEEGNLQLLQHLRAGDLAETTTELTQAVANIVANKAEKWREMKTALAAHNRNDGALTATKFILSHLRPARD